MRNHIITIAAGLALAASPLRAEGDAPLSLQDLDQRLKIAERQLELNKEGAESAAKSNGGVSAGSGGFIITSADKKFALKLGGLLQADSRNYLGEDKVLLVNDILIRRARLISQATLDKVKLNLVADFGGAAPALVDAFADIKLHDWAGARVGRFKTPLSLENHRSDPARDFVEAGFPVGLTTVRDTGLWLELADPDQAFSLGAGVFNGGLDGATVAGDVNDDKDAVAKLFIHPARFFDTVSFRDFGFGIAASSGHRNPGSAVTTYRSTGQQSVTSYKGGTVLQDNSYRLAPQAYLFNGAFSLLGEYVRSVDFATNTNNAADYRVGILGREAWQVSAGWVLTGEDAAFGGLKWNKESTGAWGVWQLAGRYQEFQVDAGNVHFQGDGANAALADQRFVNPRSSVTKIQGWGLGLNWIPAANAKLYLDFEQNIFSGGAVSATAPLQTLNRETENTLFARAQFTY